MEFKSIVDIKVSRATGCAVVGIYEGGDLGFAAKHINTYTKGLLTKLQKSGDCPSKLGVSLMLPDPAGASATRVLLIGLGIRLNFGRKQYRKAVQAAAQALGKSGASDAIIYLGLEEITELDWQYRARIVAEVFAAHAYKIPHLKTSKKSPKPALTRLSIAVVDGQAAKEATGGLKIGTALGSGMHLARDLANLPPNICTPIYLAARAKQLAREWSTIRTKIIDERGLKALKMGSFLAVSQGSEQPPRLIVCEYYGTKRSKAPICLIGKGITFDSGGISLKDPSAMDEMKFDMSGAATVLGAMRAVAELKLAINVVVIIAASENMPSGRAVKPADIVTSMSGQTIEVLNTDAEGRLVLCDAITYSRRFKPAAVVDVATLTGACIIALGNHFSGLMSNDDALAEELRKAGLRADDRAWPMPIGEEYVDQLKSNFADLANIGGREGGACTAAAFLSKFAKDLHWAHLDIAGTAWLSGSQKSSTGRPVPLLVDFLLNRESHG